MCAAGCFVLFFLLYIFVFRFCLFIFLLLCCWCWCCLFVCWLYHCDVDGVYFSSDKLYRTGDLVRIRADGIILYVGRADFQVKLRGKIHIPHHC